MGQAMGENRVVVQPELLKFARTWAEGERPSSSAKITNPTDGPLGFKVQVQATDNYEVKPKYGIVRPLETRIINVTACGLPPDEQWKGKISVLTFIVPLNYGEKDIAQVFPEKYYPLRHHAPDHAIPRYTICEYVLRVLWVTPETEIPILMNKAVEEVCQQNFGLAQETLGEAIELRPDKFLFLFRALVHHSLGQKEGVKRDLQEAQRLFSNSDLAEGTGEHFASSVACRRAYLITSDIVKVPTYTTEKLYGKQMIVKKSVAVTENQGLDVEVRLTPSIMLGPDGNVEVIVIVDYLRFEFGTTTDLYHFLQSLEIQVRPMGELVKSFSEGFGLIKWSPGNELDPLSVQQGRSRGYTAGVNLGASPSAGLQLNGNNTSGTTFSAYGFKKSKRGDGHAYVCEHELRTFDDGSSARLGRIYTKPKIPEAVQNEVNYPNLDKDASFAATWKVPYAIAVELRNELEFTISLKAKLPACRRKKSFVTYLLKPFGHELEVREVETRRTCVFAIAALKRFIEKST